MGYYTSKLLAQVGRDNRFIITVDTTKAGSASTHFVLPTTGSGYNFTADWGDGTTSSHSGTPGNIDHTYPTSGTYQIKISGVFPQIYFNYTGDKLKLISIDNWGTVQWTSMLGAFAACGNMQGRYSDSPNTSLVTNMREMFSGCLLFNSSVSGFDTQNVTNMIQMFYNCPLFNQPISNFNTTKVTSFVYMFVSSVSFKQSLSSFSLQSMLDMSHMLDYVNINTVGTTTNYDNTLISWAAQIVKPNITFNGGTSKYSDAGLAARNILTSAPNNWIITDGGHI